MGLLRRKPKVDLKRFPHVYIGPDTPYGLRTNTPGRLVGRRSGGVRFEDTRGGLWTLGKEHVVRAQQPS